MKKAFILILCCSIAFVLTGCGRPSAEKALKDYLKELKSGDFLEESDAAQKVLGELGLADEKVADILLSKYSYKILSVEEGKDRVTAEVEITNVDMDYVLEQALDGYISDALDKAFSKDADVMSDEVYGQLFLDHVVSEIDKKDVKMAKNTVTIHMTGEGTEWEVSASDELYDAALGGMLSGDFVQDTLGNDSIVSLAKEEALNQEGEGDIGDSHVVLKNVVVVKDYDDEPVAIVSYDWTNNSDETTSASSSVTLDVFQNGIAMEPSYVTSDYYDSDAAEKKVRSGSTIQVQAAFNIEDLSDIDVEATENWGFAETGKVYKTFSLKKETKK